MTTSALVALSATAVTPEIAHYLPRPSTYNARIMELMPSAEYRQLAERVAAAARRNPDWFTAHAKQNEGRPLPYDSRLGLSEAEYNRLLQAAERLEMGEVGRVPLSVEATADSGLSLSSPSRPNLIDKIVIRPQQDHVETPFGRLTHRTAIDQDNPDSPMGQWRGVQWSNQGESETSLTKLALGKKLSGECLLYYTVTAPNMRKLVLLTFDCA